MHLLTTTQFMLPPSRH